jgi:DNA-binding CsgD family transcriptional regulator
MYLNYRLTTPDDLEACYPFIRDRFHYDERLKKDAIALWKTLLEDGCCISQVIEDRDQPADKRHVGFGISMFATDRFMEEAKTTLPPFTHLRVLEKWKRGIRPFLKKADVTPAQTGRGLNVVALHYGWDFQRYNLENFIKIRQFCTQAFLTLVSGYRVKEFAEEVYEVEERELITNLGCDTYRDYKEFLGSKYLPPAIEKGHPYLMGITAEAARKKPGTAAAAIALLGSPRFSFQPPEQEILKRALLGETDEEIAAALGISLITVKKRWQGIYDKVEAVDAELLAEASEESNESGKLKQRRRYLLKNLRDHPEELWPPVASGMAEGS